MKANSKLEEILLKFGIKDNLIKEYTFWYLLVRKEQPTLGSCVIMLKRHEKRFSGCSLEEFTELKKIIADFECATKKIFNYTIMNYLMLMLIDHQVHIHAIPRYDKAKHFANSEWIDSEWPKPTSLNAKQCDRTTLDLIRDKLKIAIDSDEDKKGFSFTRSE